jgi:hypothetical protein
MRQVSCSSGNCMELGLLVNSGTWIFCSTWSFSSVYFMICAPYETGILFYRELHGTGSLSKVSYFDMSCSTWFVFVSVLNDLCTVWDFISCSTENCMEVVLLVISCTSLCIVQPETLKSVYLMICAPYETVILFYRELHGTGSIIKFLYLCLPFTT